MSRWLFRLSPLRNRVLNLNESFGPGRQVEHQVAGKLVGILPKERCFAIDVDVLQPRDVVRRSLSRSKCRKLGSSDGAWAGIRKA